MQMQTKNFPDQPCCAQTDSSRRVWQRRRRLLWVLPKLAAICVIVVGAIAAAPGESRRERITKLVVRIQRADYEGDRPTLRQLYNDLGPFADDREFGAKVRYWRGFALWRRVLNGANDNVLADTENRRNLDSRRILEASIIAEGAFIIP